MDFFISYTCFLDSKESLRRCEKENGEDVGMIKKKKDWIDRKRRYKKIKRKPEDPSKKNERKRRKKQFEVGMKNTYGPKNKIWYKKEGWPARTVNDERLKK